MTVRALRFEGDPILLEMAPAVEQFDERLTTLVRDMFETMYAAPGRGLAAPQVGVSSRVFVVDTDWRDAEPAPMIFVNPQIVGRSDQEISGTEACLSIPDKSYAVSRPTWVQMTWQDLDGVQQAGRFEGIQAVCVYHEMDHLNGLLITQTGTLL